MHWVQGQYVPGIATTYSTPCATNYTRYDETWTSWILTNLANINSVSKLLDFNRLLQDTYRNIAVYTSDNTYLYILSMFGQIQKKVKLG